MGPAVSHSVFHSSVDAWPAMVRTLSGADRNGIPEFPLPLPLRPCLPSPGCPARARIHAASPAWRHRRRAAARWCAPSGRAAELHPAPPADLSIPAPVSAESRHRARVRPAWVRPRRAAQQPPRQAGGVGLRFGRRSILFITRICGISRGADFRQHLAHVRRYARPRPAKRRPPRAAPAPPPSPPPGWRGTPSPGWWAGCG